jgi:hypothetical protein
MDLCADRSGKRFHLNLHRPLARILRLVMEKLMVG